MKQCGNYGVGGDYIPHVDRMYEGRGRKAVGDLAATIVTILQAPMAGTRLNRGYDALLVWL